MLHTWLGKIALITCLLPTWTLAKDLTESMNSLGGNKELIRKAKNYDGKSRVQVVQNRAVDRTMRLEMNMLYGMQTGGDPYVNTNSWGGAIEFHMNPRWSLGVRYTQAQNRLSDEGERVFNEAELRRSRGETNFTYPSVDYVKDSTLGTISFYPIYGKLNLFDLGISQFDLYVLAGGGNVRLASGQSPTWTAGGGAGIWFTQHFTSRLEARYQNYQDQIASGKRDVHLTIFSFSIGVLL